ncbi:unnamed protein product, partial [Mesorhabditis belari]|uniref:Uncharacterized protein n=1 Tax=Mesorhabditis belari TaxID=2138241 RepID=A0AAF3EPH4_9BILA
MGDNMEYDAPGGTLHEDPFADGSGIDSTDDQAVSVITKEVLLTLANTTTQFFSNLTTTEASLIPQEFAMNPWRVGFLVAKATFGCVLLLPLLADVGFDIYLEIAANIHKMIGVFPSDFSYYWGPAVSEPLYHTQSKEISIFSHLIVHYTGYRMFTELPWTSIVLFLIENFIFWSLLTSTILLFHFARKAISRPEDIKYTPTFWPFIQSQSIPFLLVALTAVFTLSDLPSWIFLAVSIVIRFFAVGLALIIVYQFFTSFFYYCQRRDDYVIASPHSLIRYARSRLFWIQIFALFAHSMSAPFVGWSAISLAEEAIAVFSTYKIDSNLILWIHR